MSSDSVCSDVLKGSVKPMSLDTFSSRACAVSEVGMTVGMGQSVVMRIASLRADV